MKNNEMPVDFVVAWVDNTDLEWQKQFLHYKEEVKGNNIKTAKSSYRFRDWGTLKYWFRAVEQYAPWVNRVFFVTCGQCPDWLDKNHPKLEMVNHKDYIPPEYLPCFSPQPIELNFHRIKNLSEHFVYFNDDMFIMDNVEKDDFFLNGKPRYLIAEEPLFQTTMDNDQGWTQMLMNLSGVLNANFKKHEVIKNNLHLWFPLRHPKRLLNNLLMYKFSHFSFFVLIHVGAPFLKSQMEVVWNTIPEKLDCVCRNRFRSADDVNQYLFIFWNAMTGHAEQCKHMNGTGELMLSDSTCKSVAEAIKRQKSTMLCFNDSQDITEFDKAKETIVSAFESRFPKKSSFEK